MVSTNFSSLFCCWSCCEEAFWRRSSLVSTKSWVPPSTQIQWIFKVMSFRQALVFSRARALLPKESWDLGGKPTVLGHGGEFFFFFLSFSTKKKIYSSCSQRKKIKIEVRFFRWEGREINPFFSWGEWEKIFFFFRWKREKKIPNFSVNVSVFCKLEGRFSDALSLTVH